LAKDRKLVLTPAREVTIFRMKFRPRFSIRTLAIIVTLVCAYFAAWEATKRWGEYHMRPMWVQFDDGSWHDLDFNQSSPAPFILRGAAPKVEGSHEDGYEMVYYLWVIDGKIRLPF
jgi:hypothetical protein